jgi:asparagine synthase (glutamine-hydrolysing)
MCGICGFTTSSVKGKDRKEIIDRMTQALTHRGPDDEGFYWDDDIIFGHRRLSIIDLSTGKQPIHNEDQSVWITFNGEIYNFLALRRELEEKGHTFYTTSDTEVIVHLYEEKGLRFLEQLDGMFAFALWDTKSKSLLLVRDRLGEKPLHYYPSASGLVFASELKSLLAHPVVPRELDLSALNKYLTYEYVPAPHTIYKGIYKVQPGHFVLYHNGQVKEERYWDVPMSEVSGGYKTEAEYVEELRYLLREVVRARLVSDVPVGVFLSGGIDSSLVAALANGNSAHKVRTFSIGFAEKSFDETPFSQRVAAFIGSAHHHEELSSQRMLELIPTIAQTLDEPLADASIIPTYLLSQFTARHVKVALGGDGGDELFAGYPTYQAHRLVGLYDFLPRELRDLINRLAVRLPVSYRNISWDFQIKQFLRGAGVAPEVRFFLWMGSFLDREKRQLFTKEWHPQLLSMNTFEDLARYISQSRLTNDFDRLLYLSLKLYLQDDLLVKVDRASMANSLEVRSPYLAPQLVTFVAQLPAFYKLNRLTTKYILKKAAAGLLPKEITQRKKKGFGVPLAAWFNGPLKPLLLEYLNEARIRNEGLFDYGFIHALLEDHFHARRDNRKLLWTLLVFEMWRETYLDRR